MKRRSDQKLVAAVESNAGVVSHCDAYYSEEFGKLIRSTTQHASGFYESVGRSPQSREMLRQVQRAHRHLWSSGCRVNRNRFQGQVLCRICKTTTSVAKCADCGAVVDQDVAAFCRFNGKRLNKEVLCRSCQSKITAVQPALV
jgi:hypothetical protein